MLCLYPVITAPPNSKIVLLKKTLILLSFTFDAINPDFSGHLSSITYIFETRLGICDNTALIFFILYTKV